MELELDVARSYYLFNKHHINDCNFEQYAEIIDFFLYYINEKDNNEDLKNVDEMSVNLLVEKFKEMDL